MQYRRYFWSEETRMEPAEAESQPHYQVELDAEGRLVEVRAMLCEGDPTHHHSFSYRQEGLTAVTEQRLFDQDDVYQGKTLHRFTPPAHSIIESYNAQDDLVDMIEGMFTFLVQDGRVVLRDGD